MALTKNISFIKIGYLFTFLFIFEAMVVKSAIFIDNDPVFIHYIVTSVICVIIFFISIKKLKSQEFFTPIFFTIIFCFLWSIISSIYSNILFNIFYSISFLLLLFTCIVSVPVIMYELKINLNKLMYAYFLSFGFLSLALLTFMPDIAIDPESGRFRGAYISVANASSLFPFIAIFSMKRLCDSIIQNRPRLIYLLLTALGIVLVFLTRSRGPLAETLFCVLIIYGAYFINYRRLFFKQIWIAIFAFSLTVALAGFLLPSESAQELATEFRLDGDSSLTSSRDGNWEFGIERILAKPLLGEGLLTKQTQGGAESIDVEGAGSYDPRYDPHSLVLSFGVQAGIPFAVMMVAWIVGIFIGFIRRFGLATSLMKVEFVYGLVHFSAMMFTGGDLTSLGSLADRIYLIMIGVLYIESARYGKVKRSVVWSKTGTISPSVSKLAVR